MIFRIAVVFYCLGTLDILGHLEKQSNDLDRETWRSWLWEQQICSSHSLLLIVQHSDLS